MKILVTGANGYLGQGIVRKLLDRSHEVIAADFSVDNVDTRANRVPCDLFAVDSPGAYFGFPQAVLHLAWRDGFVHNSAAHIVDLPKHYSFLRKMVEDGARQLAVMGSMHEVGFFEGSINESTPTNPSSLYGISKNALRQSIMLLCEDQSITLQWLRGYYIVGNSEFGGSIFSKIAQAEKKGQKTFPFTSGQNQWDFLDYEEFCDQVVASVEQTDINGIINICSGKPQKLAERVERFIIENNYSIKLAYGTFPDRPYDSKAVWGNDDKISKILRKRKDDLS